MKRLLGERELRGVRQFKVCDAHHSNQSVEGPHPATRARRSHTPAPTQGATHPSDAVAQVWGDMAYLSTYVYLSIDRSIYIFTSISTNLSIYLYIYIYINIYIYIYICVYEDLEPDECFVERLLGEWELRGNGSYEESASSRYAMTISLHLSIYLYIHTPI